MKNHIKLILAGFIAFLYACGGQESGSSNQVKSKRAGINEVIRHLGADPDNLNPVNSTSADAGYITGQIFQSLIAIEPDSFTYQPVLAKSRPEIEELNSGPYKGGLKITYEIREEAQWDNGEPIDAKDAAFSLKVIKNRKVDAEHLRGYYEFIDSMAFYPDNPKKFSFYADQKYFLAEIWSGITVFPEHIYDPDQLMRNFTISQLNDPDNWGSLNNNEKINTFAEAFNSEKYQRDSAFVKGSGPYKFVSWQTGQRIILKKKQDWWGEPFKDSLYGFEGYPEKLTYEIITDNTTALTALKDEQLDTYEFQSPKNYVDLQKNEGFKKLYNLYEPMELSYNYIGMNMRHKVLGSRDVRQALAHVTNKPKMMDVLMYDMADPTVGPVHPSKSYYNDTILPYEYNIDKAKQLLESAGWKDNDGNGVREKTIDGEKTELSLEIKYNSGNTIRENIALMLQKEAEKAGIKISITQKEWTVFLDEIKNHNFDMYIGGWIQAPLPGDPKQIWHSNSYNGGSNFVGFGDSKSDALIEELRYTLDEDKQAELYMEFQEMVHKRVPYIFLWTKRNNIAIHKRYDNADPMVKRPGYDVAGFKLKKNFGKTINN